MVTRAVARSRSLRALLAASLLGAASAAWAQQPAPAPVINAAPVYAPGTDDAWVDRQLASINAYAARYPDAFVDELVRYAGARRGYVQALMGEHGWSAGDVYFACFWGKVTQRDCRELVRARSAMPGAGWKQVVESLQPPPENLDWRALRHAIVASHDHWDRPITLDALLQRQLGDRAQRDAASRSKDGKG